MKKLITLIGASLLLTLFSLGLVHTSDYEQPIHVISPTADLLCSLGGQDPGHTNY